MIRRKLKTCKEITKELKEKFPKEDWKYEVMNEDTVLGYWEWISHKIEVEK